MNHNFTRPAVAVLAAVALGASLTACAPDDADSQSQASAGASRAHNDADVRFARQMIPHHAQALEMVDLAEGRPLSSDVGALAESIRAAQTPEIKQMSGWLREWGERVPSIMADHGSGGAAGMLSMEGMMSEQDMIDLAEASDSTFQQMWLSMMIEHHAGAITMAQAEERNGEFDPAIAVARSIASSQQKQIRTMERLRLP